MPDINGANILVVDDEPEIRLFLSKVIQLSRTNDKIVEAINGLDALEKLAEHTIDLMIVDLNMPGMGGKELIEKVREQDSRIAIVVLTGHGSLKDAYELLEDFEIADFLTKPLNAPAQLLFSVAKALEMRQLLINQDERIRELEVLQQVADRAKHSFLDLMNHEFRTPMNAVIGFSQLLMNSDLTDEQALYIENVFKGAQDLLSNIQKILEVSNIKSGNVAFEFMDVDLTSTIAEIVTELTPLAKQKKIRISVADFEENVWVDALGLRKALKEIVENAIKYNLEDGKIEIESELVGANKLKLIFRDTGVGISDDHRARLFELFRRDCYEYTSESGIGLGLALSKELLSRMGGTIGANNNDTSGCTFWVELPVEP